MAFKYIEQDIQDVKYNEGQEKKDVNKVLFNDGSSETMVWERWMLKTGSFLAMTSNTTPEPFNVTMSHSGKYSTSTDKYWYAFDNNSSTSLTITGTKTEFNGANGICTVSLKFGKPIRIVEWTANGSFKSSTNGERFISFELDGVDVGDHEHPNGIYTKSYADTELGYLEADGIRLRVARTVYGDNGGDVSGSIKDIQITKWYEKG